jgi:hypothetical protein
MAPPYYAELVIKLLAEILKLVSLEPAFLVLK